MTEMYGSPQEVMADFAAEKIQKREHLGNEQEFPWDLWLEMGDLGLLDPDQMTIPFEMSGMGRFQTLADTARTMVSQGGNLGLTMAWTIHHLCSYLVLDTPAGQLQKVPFIRQLKTGRVVFSFAFSEAEAGGHPKYLKARAEKKDDDYVLSGEKTYLTNGPVAGAFIVVVVTGQVQGRKSFTAFLLDRNTKGLRVLPGMEIPFFKPALHGGIKLDGCRVGAETVIGELHQAYPEMVMMFQRWEDAVMSAAVAGAVSFLIRKTAGKISQKISAEINCLAALGELAAMAEAADTISRRLSCAIDAKGRWPEGSLLYFKSLVAEFLQQLENFWCRYDICLEDGAAPILFQDLTAVGRIGKNLLKLRYRRLGDSLARRCAAR